MDINEFSSPLPKPWLDINADPINTRISSSQIGILSGPVNAVTALPTILTADQVVNGVIGINASSALTGTLTFPSAIQLNAVIGNDPFGLGSYYFVCYLYLRTNGSGSIDITIAPGAGVAIWTGESTITIPSLTANSRAYRVLIFSANENTGWTMYLS